MSTAGCWGAHPAPPSEATAPPELHLGPLTDYVPAPTLRWLLQAEPARIAREPGTLASLAPLIGEDAWSAFAERNGFDLREMPAALVAGFDFGTLFLLPATGRDDAIERSFRQRLLRGESTARPHPDVIRVRGLVGQTPQALLRARGHLVALASGDPTLTRIVEGYLLGRFHKTPPALAGSALRAHADFASGSPLRLWIPGPQAAPDELPPPFDGWAGSLPGVTAFLASGDFFEEQPCACRPGAPGGPALRVHVAAVGPWDPASTSPEPLGALWESLASSAPGRLLQLNAPLREPRLAVAPLSGGARLDLTVDLALRPLLQGLHQLLAGDLAGIFPPRPSVGGRAVWPAGAGGLASRPLGRQGAPRKPSP